MPRTGENIYKRKDGRFEARYIAYRDEKGKAVYKAVYGRSKAEAREKLENARRLVKGELSGLDGKTFREVAEEYLDSAKESIASTTFDRYQDALERDIYPEYADTPMAHVTEAEMNRFLKLAPEAALKRGRTIPKSSLLVVKAVLRNVINFANAYNKTEVPDLLWERSSYEELLPSEIEKICLKAKYNPSSEMLAVLLSLFCGMRTGELAALQSDDVDIERNEIFIHKTVHRVKNPKRHEPGEKKTVIVVEEMPWKKQIRKVKYPAVLTEFIGQFRCTGKPLIREKDDEQTDPRTLENRLGRLMDEYSIPGVNFERLRKTYITGKADEQILDRAFRGISSDTPCVWRVDKDWLKNEMIIDLVPLRMLIGFSIEEVAEILGVSVGMYRQLESGSRELSWDQYMALLFLYDFNVRTSGVVDILGLYPESLKSKVRIGDG